MWSDHFAFALRAPAPVPAHIVLPCSVVALNLNGSYQLTMYIARQKITITLLQLYEKYCIIIKCGDVGSSAPILEQYRSGHNGHDWKSCDGRKPSVSSNLTCSANSKRTPPQCPFAIIAMIFTLAVEGSYGPFMLKCLYNYI